MECIHGAADGNGAMGSVVPQVAVREEYSAFPHPSTERKSVTRAAGGVLPPVDRGQPVPLVARKFVAGVAGAKKVVACVTVKLSEEYSESLLSPNEWEHVTAADGAVNVVLPPADKEELLPSIEWDSVPGATGVVLCKE